jgi:hypothetical protein
MTVYMVAQVQVLDSEQWERYKEIAAREIARHGGTYLARGARPEVEEADWNQPEDLDPIPLRPAGRQAVPAPRGIRRLRGGLPRRPSLTVSAAPPATPTLS